MNKRILQTLMATPWRPAEPPSQPESDGLRLVKDGQPLSVLIVDDDALVGGFLSEAIEDRGGHVIGFAQIPSDAFGLTVEHKPDVVVMDVVLKDGRDGLHAADAIRVLYRTPIVFCAAHDDSRALERIRGFGGSECLCKPVRPADLCKAILRACELPLS
jgi:two-component system, response regulator PdtaR